jgi:D-arabinose 1-dehydrogenase-like Zn-dependent alcohol dehydrogenase
LKALIANVVAGQHFKCVNVEQFGTANWDEGCFGTGIAWDVSALFKIPDSVGSEYAGPLMCGGASKFLMLLKFVYPGR